MGELQKMGRSEDEDRKKMRGVEQGKGEDNYVRKRSSEERGRRGRRRKRRRLLDEGWSREEGKCDRSMMKKKTNEGRRRN